MAATGYEKDIDLPGPRKRTRGLLLDAARELPADALTVSNVNRLTAGVTWLPWGEIVLTTAEANCLVEWEGNEKGVRELPTVMYQPAFLIYDALTCGTLSGMLDELWERLAVNFDVGVSAAFARQLEFAAEGGLGLEGASNYGGDATADYVPAVGGAATSLRVALNSLENYLASELLNGVGMIHMTPGLLTLAAADDLIEWDGSVYRTATGHVVVGDAGHTGLSTPDTGVIGTTAAPWIYATGDVWYAMIGQPRRMDAESGEGYQLLRRNQDRPLAELYGVILFDPNILAAARVTVA